MAENLAEPLGLSVGVVTRTKNRPVLLRRAMQSIKHQTYKNWRLVVVNDGGEPGPVEEIVAHVFGPDETRVKVVHNPSSVGMEAASNIGIRLLDTDLASIHDDDDSWAPAFLSIVTQVYARQTARFPSVKGVVVRVNAVYETVSANHIKIERVEHWQADWFDTLEEGFLSLQKIVVRNQFPPIAFVFDLATCKQLGLFNEELPVLGDWDFHLRLAMKYDIWIHPEYLAFYHHRVSLQGALGNSVHAGSTDHKNYRQLLLNKWLRESFDDSNSSRMLFTSIYELHDKVAVNHRLTSDHITHIRDELAAQLKQPVRTKLGSKVSKLIKSIKQAFSRKLKNA